MQTHAHTKLTFSSYKIGAVACGVGSMICDKTGHPIGKDVLQGGAYCCAAVAAAVTASQGPSWQAAAQKIGNAAVVGYDGAIAGGKLVGQCVSGVCKVVAKKVTGRSSVDGSVSSVRAINISDDDENLTTRFAEPEPESDEDAVLLSRYAEPEPESVVGGLE